MSRSAHLAVESINRLRMKETCDLSVGNSPDRVAVNTLHWARNVLILSDSLVNLCGRQLEVLGISVAATSSWTWAGAAGCGGCWAGIC